MANIDQIDVLDLQCVVVLAETLNFTETAKRLHMTQPGITAHINKVEKSRGYRLFDRRKGILRTITPEGFVFVEEAKLVLEDIRRLLPDAVVPEPRGLHRFWRHERPRRWTGGILLPLS